jgi:hypothetical protein
MLTALSIGTALCHLLEMPAKITLDGALWLFLLQNLYPPAFGTAGAFFEVGAVITTVVLVLLVHRRRPAFGWTLPAALCMVAAHIIFWVWIAPVNAEMAPLPPETLAVNWMELRDQWEYSHAARAILQIIALGALLFSILVEIPTDGSKNRPAYFLWSTFFVILLFVVFRRLRIFDLRYIRMQKD